MPIYKTMRLMFAQLALVTLVLPVYLFADDPARLYARAGSLAAKGSWEEARRAYLEAYASLKTTRGPEDPRTVLALANACDASVPLAAQLDSLAVCTRALELRKKVFGPDSAEVAASMSDLALLYAAEGDLNRAIKLMERALRASGAAPGSPEAVGCMNNLGYLYFRKGKYALSREMFARALDAADVTNGTATADGSDRLSMLVNLGTADLAAHDARSAEIHFRSALALAEESFGTRHPRYLRALGDLARAEAALGNREEAAVLQSKAQAIGAALMSH